MKKNAPLLSLLFLAVPLFVSGCGKSDFSYSEETRSDLTRSSKIIISAIYKNTSRLSEKNLIDFVEGRKGFSNKMEHAVLFRVKQFVKGSFPKQEFSVGVNLPSMAFGIKPGEYSGQKKFTIYIAFDEKLKRDVVIGAEWETVKY